MKTIEEIYKELMQIERHVRSVMHQLGATHGTPEMVFFGQQMAKMKLDPIRKRVLLLANAIADLAPHALAGPPDVDLDGLLDTGPGLDRNLEDMIRA